ncbi:MAG: hypothetical protein JW810_06280 [Sedimentisphaerales bacterium]|nr:hypothetical protein [Sedimentisphaerales bacterium]
MRLGASGRLRLDCWDPEKDYRRLFSLACGDVSVENGTAGPFRTGLHKVVTIRDFSLDLFDPERIGLGDLWRTWQPVDPTETPSDQQPARAFSQRSAEILLDGWADGAPTDPLDVHNTTEIRIHNFRVHCYDGTAASLSIESARAWMRPWSGQVSLQGRVVLRWGDDRFLQTNQALWNLADRRFEITGRYILRAGGRMHSGRSVRLDEMLQPLPTNTANPSPRKDESWQAKR